MILYNHRYDLNIPRLEKIYKGKFSHIYHIMPFYDGNVDNVISVYDKSYQFESFIAQAYQKIKNEGYTHYFIVADDMVVNPDINENNFFDYTGISKNSPWIKDLRDYKTHPHIVPIYVPIKKRGVEVEQYLLPTDGVCDLFKKNNLSFFPHLKYVVSDFCVSLFKKRFGACWRAFNYLRHYKNKEGLYPGIWGYSDILLIPSTDMEKFAFYCGVFGSLDVFVENAIPLSLIISSSQIQTEKNIKLKTISQLYELGNEGKEQFERKYSFSLEKLMSDYPNNYFFIHPLKLSKWK